MHEVRRAAAERLTVGDAKQVVVAPTAVEPHAHTAQRSPRIALKRIVDHPACRPRRRAGSGGLLVDVERVEQGFRFVEQRRAFVSTFHRRLVITAKTVEIGLAGDLRARKGQAELHAAGRAEIQGDVGSPGIFGGAIVARGAGRAFLAVFVARIPGTNVIGVHEILDFGGREINDGVPTQRDVLSVNIEYPEIDAPTVLPKTAFETDLFVDTRDRRKALAIKRAHTLKAEGLGVDAIEIDPFGEHYGETAREAGVLQTQLLVLHIFTGEGVAAIRRRDLFVVFPERPRAIILVVAIPIVAGADEGQHATAKVAPAGRERNGRGLAPLGAVSRARAAGEGRERFECDGRGVGEIRRLQRVEERAGIEPRVVEEEAETDAVRVCIQRATTVDVVGIVGIEAIVEHLIFAVFGATHEELLHPFPLVE